MQARCTQTSARLLTRLLDEDARNRMHQRATPQAMRFRRSTVELPFAVLKYRIFGHPRLLLRGVRGAQTEMAIATMVYDLKRIASILGGLKLTQQLRPV